MLLALSDTMEYLLLKAVDGVGGGRDDRGCGRFWFCLRIVRWTSSATLSIEERDNMSESSAQIPTRAEGSGSDSISSCKVACPCKLGVYREDERPTRCREEVAIAEGGAWLRIISEIVGTTTLRLSMEAGDSGLGSSLLVLPSRVSGNAAEGDSFPLPETRVRNRRESLLVVR